MTNTPQGSSLFSLSSAQPNATQARTMATRLTDTLNAIDFGCDPGVGGAVGADSTVQFQKLIDAAFGPITAPNGIANPWLNKNIFIPAGNYVVSAPAQQAITAAAVDATNGNKMKVTVGSTANLKTGYYVYITGASGSDDGTTQAFSFNFNAPHPIQVLNSTQFLLSLPNPWPATGTYVSGGVVNTAALHINGVLSGMISGAGRDTTTIQCTNGPVLGVNGWSYGKLEDIAFVSAQGTCCVDFNTDATTTPNTQSITISNCAFNLNGPAIVSLTGSERAAFMCGWGSGSLCSEFLHLNNYYGCTNGDGFYLGSFNALGHTIIGGAVQQCGVNGIYVGSGSIGAIIGTAFENGLTTYDIRIGNSVGDATSIIGVRSETKNFAFITAGPGIHIAGCNHQGAAGGTFVYYTGTGSTPPSGGNVGGVTIDSSFTANGSLQGGNGYMFLRNVVCGAGLNTLLGSFGLIQNLGTIVACDFCPLPFSGLPTPTQFMAGMRMMISDGPASPTFGAAASGGASPAHYVPVHVDWNGTTASWVFG